MRIIFLDIDGVLNSMSGLIFRGGQSLQDLYTEHISVLIWLLRKTDAKIVVSSTWRIGKSVSDLKQLFYNYGLPSKYIIDKTDRLSGEQRGKEIKLWLDETEHNIESFVILDDDSDMDGVEKYHVQTKHDYGLTYVEALECFEILTGRKGIELLRDTDDMIIGEK